MDKAAELFKQGIAPQVLTSGDRSVSLDNQGLTQPFSECDKTAEYLIEHGVPNDVILRERDSRDTISNLYYIKTQFLIPNQQKRLLFVVTDFRISRLKYLCDKILGDEYEIAFEGLSASQEGSTFNEDLTMQINHLFLEHMKPGDHEWLKDKFYTAWMYQFWKERRLDRMRER
jgi:uncharacterized SAM-binding protein YcdF (DUF218 family)